MDGVVVIVDRLAVYLHEFGRRSGGYVLAETQ